MTAQSPVAKGIRRIVGVTRGVAGEAKRVADAYEIQLKAADLFEDISLDAEVRRLGAELDTLTMSASTKYSFRQRQNALFQKAKAIKKKVTEERVSQAVMKGTEEAEKAKSADQKVMVFRADFGVDVKAATKVLDKVAKGFPEVDAFMLFTADVLSDRWICIAAIPGSKAKGRDASKWVKGVLELVGGKGKGGGKGDKAQGMDEGVANIDAAMAGALGVDF
ncbi:unnamed protein product [Choristocarpus tenellus]